jgi:hypothetical protein
MENIKMILSEYIEGPKQANVCKQSGEWVTMLYLNGEYIRSEVASSETSAKLIADEWINNHG